jgi:hypothetical protein
LRFDLLAFPKKDSCEGTFAVNRLGAGKFEAVLDGVKHNPIWLVSTKQFEALAGPQVVTMDVLGTSPQEMGVSLACDATQKPNVTSVSMLGPDKIVINGTRLGEVSRVTIKDLGTKFQILNKTATSVTAKILDSASFVLGQTSELLVSNAWGQTSVSFNVVLSAGSVQPTHLDLAQDWPFPTRKSLSLIEANSELGIVGSVADVANATDSNIDSYVEFEQITSGEGCDSNNLTTLGQIVYQVGDGTSVYQGNVAIRSAVTGSTANINIYSTNDLSQTLGTSMALVGSGSYSANPEWKEHFFSGKYLVLRGSCAYNSGDTIQLYDVRVTALPE